MKKRLFDRTIYLTLAVLILLLPICPSTVYAAEAKVDAMPELKSQSATLYALNTDQEIISHQSLEKKYPVTLAKMMTAILAIEYADTAADFIPQHSEKVTIGYEIESITTVEGEDPNVFYNSCGLRVGEEVSLPDLITAMIVCDADDAALAIARYIGRKVMGGVQDSTQKYDKNAIEYFVVMMNNRASIMGLSNTHFDNCTGVKSGLKSFSTAVDMAKISAEYLKYGYLREVSQISSKKFWRPTGIANEEIPEQDDGNTDSSTDGSISTPSDLWINQNELIKQDSLYYYADCKGLIAGTGLRYYPKNDYNDGTTDPYTSDNYAYISAYAERNGIRVVAVVMGNNIEDAYNDIKNMFDYIFNNYVLHTYVEQGQAVAKYQVTDPMNESDSHLTVVADRGGEYLTRIDELDLFGYEIRLNSAYDIPREDNVFITYIAPPAGILKGDVVGTMDIYYNTEYIDTVSVYAANTIAAYEDLPQKKTAGWYMNIDWSLGIYTVLVLTLIILILFSMFSIINNLAKQYKARKRYSGARRKNASRYYGKKKY